jgi:hypothetical protein
MKKRNTPFFNVSFRVLSLAMALGIGPAAYAQTPITFSGTIFRDANGLMDTLSDGTPNPTINGTPISTVTVANQPPTQIYVYLRQQTASQTDSIVEKATVNVSGQYSLVGNVGTNYNLRISTTDVPVGTVSPQLNFPESFKSTGEGVAAGGDLVPDFSVSLNAPITNLTVNFGVNGRPLGNNYTIFNPSLAPGTNGNPDSIVIPAIAFNASDPEDGFYPSGLAGRSVYVLSGNGGNLYYNGRLLSASAAGSSSLIDSFVSDSLRFVRNPTASAFSIAFSVIDNAGVNQLIPSLITINATPLPVSLLSFEAHREGTSAMVRWSAPSEAAGMGFYVERSVDGRNFATIGHVASITEGNTTVDYRFEDRNLPSTTTGGKIYYRLRQTSLNGKAEYSKVAIINSSSFKGTSAQLSLYPNPASTVLHVALDGTQGTATVVLSDATGRIVDRKVTTPEGTTTLEVSSLPAGMYFVQYRTEDNELIATERIAITR